MPIRAVPASPMIVRTSAKSTLIKPGLRKNGGERRIKKEYDARSEIENRRRE